MRGGEGVSRVAICVYCRLSAVTATGVYADADARAEAVVATVSVGVGKFGLDARSAAIAAVPEDRRRCGDLAVGDVDVDADADADADNEAADGNCAESTLLDDVWEEDRPSDAEEPRGVGGNESLDRSEAADDDGYKSDAADENDGANLAGDGGSGDSGWSSAGSDSAGRGGGGGSDPCSCSPSPSSSSVYES